MRPAFRTCRTGFAGTLAAFLFLAACAGASDSIDDPILVSAAASLTDAFVAMEGAFETSHPGVDVVLNFGGSSMLREQILAGAPADVFASANEANMALIADADIVAGEPVSFATNLLAVAVPAGNPGGVSGLGDFADEELLIGLCAQGVPCGDFGREVLRSAGVTPSVDTEEPNVRALLTKVEAGELDAGLVYVTDVASTNGTVEGIDIPEEENVIARYPIAALADAPNPDGAAAFVAFVLSDDGRAVLAEYGFGAP
ncbi:MAG: molybdate ABC transporter substrate-binding protein [Actinomycetota bacterium]